jgi:hypothetical protein
MAVVNTQLAAICAQGDSKITVASATGFNPGNFILVENELMQQTAAANGAVVPVRRGLDGTVQATHASAAFACSGLTSDFPAAAPGQCITYGPYAPDGQMAGYFTYNASGAIALTPGIHVVNGSGVCVMTLAAPSGVQEGALLVIESKNLNANTITAAPIFLGVVNAGGIATASANGGNLTLKACGGKWAVLAASGIAFT